ncbi:hypothetical protein [Microvirga makkahensis]|uniref:Uncharacterized protein n=1 Tax=Microvirga makkahensis TaxID=1128670 RepID=A0A7X3MTZ6_9HYPH|nr:hypothetical protein [Microvirga makkahensis]MXQ13177.1 hypothetical protein [Microvirga makkahensis]
MLQEAFILIVNFLIVDPLQAELDRRLSEARAPQAVIADVRACADAALPVLADRVTGDPAWAASTALDVWLERSAPEDVLVKAAPQCDGPVRAAKGYLQGQGV